MIEIERKQKIWEEIIEEAKRNHPQKLEGEMTVTDFAVQAQLHRDYARTILDKEVENGKLKVRVTAKARYYSPV